MASNLPRAPHFLLAVLAISLALATTLGPACLSVAPTKPKGCAPGNCGSGGSISTTTPSTGGAQNSGGSNPGGSTSNFGSTSAAGGHD
jgi:hypothetical protein